MIKLIAIKNITLANGKQVLRQAYQNFDYSKWECDRNAIIKFITDIKQLEKLNINNNTSEFDEEVMTLYKIVGRIIADIAIVGYSKESLTLDRLIDYMTFNFD